MGHGTLKDRHYSIAAIFLSLVLLGGVSMGSIPFANATHDDSDDDECPKKHKYGDICDEKKPKIKITFPKRFSKITGPDVTITGTASDDLSGIKNVKVNVDWKGFKKANYADGEWDYTAEDLDRGWHVAIAKAKDNANNVKRTFVFFFVK